jgi:hypothetical protein
MALVPEQDVIVPHLLTRRPVELFAFRVWPLMVVFLWVVILMTGGVLGYTGWPFILTGAAAGASSFVHFLKPYDMRVRYAALMINEVAMVYRAFDYILEGRPWRLSLVGVAIWATIATAKLVVFMLSSQVVEIRYALRRSTE